MIDELFVKRVFVPKKAVSFGFKESDGEYVYESEIMNGEFRLYVLIRPDGRVDTRLIETETDEEYTLYKTEAVGTFVGRVRTSVEEVLCLIAEKCFDSHLFASPQMNEIIGYASEKYGDSNIGRGDFMKRILDCQSSDFRKMTAKEFAAFGG